LNALILVDLQNDFLPGGALEVPEGNDVIPIANRLLKRFRLTIATQDWHPADHGSFAANHIGKKPGEKINLYGIQQILWPTHCVQGTLGANLAAELENQNIGSTFLKGTDKKIDSYSGFFDNRHQRGTGLNEHLRQQQVDTVYILGLATDFCVKFTALDARALGYTTYLVEDGCRGVNLQPDDIASAYDEMTAAGVRIVASDQIHSEVV